MYDCQADRYTEFAAQPRAAAQVLQGTLTAHPLPEQDPTGAFDELEALARSHGYRVERAGDRVKVEGIHLADALHFNASFAAKLLIDCHLRHAQPVPFNAA